MGERYAYAPGTFSFVELGCDDPDDARRFYAGLLGWEAAPPTPGELGLTRLRGHDVAAISAVEEGRAPGWVSYVTVDDAAEVAERAAELGGAVVHDPFDVPGAGRTATVADPHGAAVALWEPHGHAGAGLVNDAGAFCWNELTTPGVPAAERFWGELLGWSFRPGGELFPPRYRLVEVDGRLNAGMRPVDERPPGWLVYFTVEEITDACERALELGGAVVERPQPLYGGTFAVIADRQGLEVALWEGDPDP